MSRATSTMDHLRATPGLLRNVVVIAVIVVLGVVTAGVILVEQRISFPWQDEYVFRAAFTETPGISPGNGQEIRIAGVPAGWISAAEVSEEGQAVLTFELDPEHGPVHDNAHLVLRPKSPLNEMYVEMDPGGPPGAPLEPGAIIPVTQTTRPIQIEEPLTALDATARTALRSLLAESDAALADAGNDLPAGLEQLAVTTEGLRPVVEGLATRRELLRTLVTSLGDVAEAAGGDDARLRELVAAATATLGTIEANDDALRATLAELPGVTDQLGATSLAVSDLTDELDPALAGLAAAADSLPDGLAAFEGLVDRLDVTLDRAAPLIDEARPLLADLRPLVSGLRTSVADLRAVTPGLTPLTADLAQRLPELQAFVYNTESVLSTQDANGPILRGLLVVDESSVPLVDGDLPFEGDRG